MSISASGNDMLHDLLVQQSLAPSFTNLVRWQTHRYVMRQSVGFFADDKQHGRELWISDGAQAGTRMLRVSWDARWALLATLKESKVAANLFASRPWPSSVTASKSL